MGVFSGIGDVLEGIGGFVEDTVQGVVASVEGAIRGDPLAMVQLGLTVYTGVNLYNSISASLAQSVSTTAQQSVTTTAVTSGTIAAEKAAQQGLEESIKASAGKASLAGTEKVVAEKAVAEVKKSTLEKVFGEVSKEVVLRGVSTALLLAASPDTEFPEQRIVRPDEFFDSAAQISLGRSGGSGISRTSASSGELTNIKTLGRL